MLPGQQIGTLSSRGSHCFPRACLHWGWLRGDTYLDPLLLVGGGPIVLLPLWRPGPPQPFPDPPFASRAGRLLHLRHALDRSVGEAAPSRARPGELARSGPAMRTLLLSLGPVRPADAPGGRPDAAGRC